MDNTDIYIGICALDMQKEKFTVTSLQFIFTLFTMLFTMNIYAFSASYEKSDITVSRLYFWLIGAT